MGTSTNQIIVCQLKKNGNSILKKGVYLDSPIMGKDFASFVEEAHLDWSVDDNLASNSSEFFDK